MHALGHDGLKVRRSGLCVHPLHSYLAASPDRVVFDPSSADSPHGLLEIKCPSGLYNKDFTPVDAALEDSDFFCRFVEGNVKLKETHAYYYQVQGQMGVTGLKWCDFFVWAGPGRVSVERIPFDVSLWQDEVLPALQSFYQAHAAPFLNSLSC